MGITFHCSSCGTRYHVDASLAGRTARCKACQQTMTIPAAEAVAAAKAPATAGRPAPGRPSNWLDAVNSQVALKPITERNLRPVKQKPSPLDDASFSGLYGLAEPETRTPGPAGSNRGPAVVKAVYKKEMLAIQRSFRWLNETANLIAIPFLGVFLLGVLLRSKPLCLLAATVVVLLNITRLFTGVANVAALAFRDGPLQGLMFLVPPLTFWYLYANWNRVRKPVSRVAGPALTIGAVILAFAFLPFLSGKSADKDAGVRERLRAGKSALKEGISETLEKKAGISEDDLRRLPGKAADAARDLKGQARDLLGEPPADR